MREACIFVLVGVVATAGWAADAPPAVSPGDTTKLVLVENRCPTFSWGGVEGASGYELVAYRLGEEGEEAQPVLRQRVTGTASSWTPAVDSCLERGGRYAWSVRAVGPGAASRWSAPSLFEVAAGPSEAELEQALAVVREFLVTRGGAKAKGDAATRAGPKSGTEVAASSPAPTAVGTTQLSVDGGVEATSFTGDGSTLTNLDPANLSGAVAVAKGGTGASTAGDARTNLGAAAAAHPHTESDVIDLTHTTDTVLTEGQVETFVTNGPLNGSGFTNLDGSNVSTGTVAEARIADEMTRDSEIGALIRAINLACPGALLSANRYTDCGNGTVRDNNTGSFWLKNANCFGNRDWPSAEADAAGLADGACGLTDGSSAGDWRQPTILEFCSAWSGFTLFPCPAEAASDSMLDSSAGPPTVAAGHPFVGVQNTNYWSATESGANAWLATTGNGGVTIGSKTAFGAHVWAVRVGQ